MKITIVSNQSGEIIGTFKPETGKGNFPNKADITPHNGQQVHEVEVPDMKAESLYQLHDTHLVEVVGKTAKLVERKTS